MSALNTGALEWVQTFEQSATGQFFLNLDPNVVVLFQLIHIVGFVILLTAVVLLALKAFGALQVLGERALPVAGLYRGIVAGLLLAGVSGVALFVTSATHYFTNKAMPVKMLLLIVAAVLSWLLLKRSAASFGANIRAGRLTAALLLGLWFATGFAGRAIGFI